MEDINEDIKNLYVIRQRLAALKKKPGKQYFSYHTKNFLVKIMTYRIQEVDTHGPNDSIVKHNVVDVYLYEEPNLSYIDLEKDIRFCNYKSIKYKDIPGYSTGTEMPIITLCELIKYLHRLCNLAVFA